MQNWEREPSSG